MEYLFIIAFVGILIFKGIMKSRKTKAEDTGKTMLPGKRPIVVAQEKRKPELNGNWEEWFADDLPEKNIPVKNQVTSSYKPVVSAVSNKKKKDKRSGHEPAVSSEKSIKLNSKEKLRRAIIYSEIINRKY